MDLTNKKDVTVTPIDTESFQRLLFRTAFCLMACDGDIDEREVLEMRKMNESGAYFRGIDLSDELDELLRDLKEKGRKIVQELFDTLKGVELNFVQELLLLEISFRIINADERVDENEIKFVRYLRSKLCVYDEIILDRFGPIEYLFDKDYSHDIVIETKKDDFFTNIINTEIRFLENIDYSMFKDEK